MSKWMRRLQPAFGFPFRVMHSMSAMKTIGVMARVSPRVTVNGDKPPAITLLSGRTAWIASAAASTIAA